MNPLLLSLALSAGSPDTEALARASVDEILERASVSLRSLGEYRVQTTTEERIGGKMNPPMTLQLWVREEPLAVRAEFISGKGKGRRVLYDSKVRAGDMRVREAGILSVIGGLWVGTRSSLAFGDTNHPITDVGIGAILRIWSSDVQKAKAFGGYGRTDEGLNERGRYCMLFQAPTSSSGLYAVKSRICLDPATALPLEITDWDAKGLLERFVFHDLEPHGAEAGEVFSLKAAGL